MPYERATNAWSADLKAAQKAWGAANNITITWRDFGPSVDYAGYVDRVMKACQNGTLDDFDVIWLEASYVGELSDCLLDLWAWNDALGADHSGTVARGGYIKDRLVALPAELSFGILAYNWDLLATYDYPYPPEDIPEMESMATAIITGERARDHSTLSGLTGAFVGEDLSSFAYEMLASVGGNLINETTGVVSVAHTPVANLLARMLMWISTGIIDQNDIGQTTMDQAIARWVTGESVFLRTTTSNIPKLIEIMNSKGQDAFNWGVSPVPSGEDQRLGSGATEGWYTGVYKNSKNKGAALRTVEWLTSQLYQEQKILKVGPKMVGTYPPFLINPKICSAYGSVRDQHLCLVYSQVDLVRRPVTETGPLYLNVSAIFQNFMKDVLMGNTYPITALKTLDSTLRVLLGNPPTDYSSLEITDTSIGKPGKIVPKNIMTQLTGLFFVVSVTAIVVLLYRRKRRDNLHKKLRASAQAVVENTVTTEGGVPPEMEQVEKQRQADKGKGVANDDSYEEDASLIQKSEKIEL
ncbi:hypothetical protein DFS34DRAFT_581145 [Phlyctochytrium arcticum]|nr:hypothetical protein DFS34DRAFT_581145 [Phlyctochytrium arcticum]